MKNPRFRIKLVPLLLLLLLTMTMTSSASPDPAKWRGGEDEEGDEHRTGMRYPLPTQQFPFARYIRISNQTIDASSSFKLLAGAPLATNTRAIEVGVLSGSLVNYSDSNVASSASPWNIGSQTPLLIPVATRTPDLHFRPMNGSATIQIREK